MPQTFHRPYCMCNTAALKLRSGASFICFIGLLCLLMQRGRTKKGQFHGIALFLFPLRGLLQSQPPFCSDIFSHVSDRRHRRFCSSRNIEAIRLRSNEWANTARHGCHRRARLQHCLGCDRGRAHGRWDVDGRKPTARLRKRKVYVE